MTVMPANSSGWFWHVLARETGRIGHLYSPKAQRGPWPWFPYALDNGAFACWNSKDNTFDYEKWKRVEQHWEHLIFWASCAPIKPRWAIVPDVPGNAKETLIRYPLFMWQIMDARIPLALAVQDGMEPADVLALEVQPDVICVGGSTEWKWSTVERWAKTFPRVHLLRCNAPDKLDWLESIGVESCDGTGWNRGDKKQTSGLERWARKHAQPIKSEVWPFTCRAARDKMQEVFA